MKLADKRRLRFTWLRKLMNVIINIFGHHERPRGHFDYKIGQAKPKQRKRGMLELQITNEQKIPVSLSPKTATGKPAKLDPNNPPKWSVVSGDSTVVPAADGLSADLISSDTPGDTTFLVEADADLGDGVVTIQDTIKLTVVGALAENLGLTAGTAVPK